MQFVFIYYTITNKNKQINWGKNQKKFLKIPVVNQIFNQKFSIFYFLLIFLFSFLFSFLFFIFFFIFLFYFSFFYFPFSFVCFSCNFYFLFVFCFFLLFFCFFCFFKYFFVREFVAEKWLTEFCFWGIMCVWKIKMKFLKKSNFLFPKRGSKTQICKFIII